MSNPTMTLKQLKEWNDQLVDAFEKKEISILEYHNGRMYVLLCIGQKNFLPEEED